MVPAAIAIDILAVSLCLDRDPPELGACCAAAPIDPDDDEMDAVVLVIREDFVAPEVDCG